MIDFESMLEDIVKEKKKENKSAERREIVIRYMPGHEKEASVVGVSTKGEDQIAMMYALGKAIGERTGLDGQQLGTAILQDVTKNMMKMTLMNIIGGMVDD